MQVLASWLQATAVPEYFASVSIDANNQIITCKDANNNTLMEYNIYSKTFSIYKSSDIAETFNIAKSAYACAEPNSDTPTIAVKCNGGIMILISNINEGSAKGWYLLNIIITKTNNGKTAIIAGTYYYENTTIDAGTRIIANSIASKSGVHAVAWGDETSESKTLSFYPSSQNQTQFISFTTYSQPDLTSYTPKAFYLPVCEFYTTIYGKFESNGVVYITNGYWAIKDA
jgi:hypothetical protein